MEKMNKILIYKIEMKKINKNLIFYEYLDFFFFLFLKYLNILDSQKAI
jgi:hypothetical protein